MPIAFPPTVFYRAPLMSGDAGVEQTINEMRGLVDEALRDPQINRLARDIVRSAPAFDDLAEANALYEWVRRNIRFTKDPVNKETLYPPAELLKIRAGDCDDISMLLATLLMSVGYEARLMTVAASGDEFSHVYVEANINGQWIPLDPARYDSQFGVAPPAFTRARWWSLSDASHGDLSGTKVFVQPGATAHVHCGDGARKYGQLGDYPRFRSHVSGGIPHPGFNGMGAYTRTMRGMGDEPASGSTTSATIATIEQGAADIIRASQGQPASPFDYSASGPWSSFQTRYSPYGPGAGYDSAAPGIHLSTGTPNWALWLAIGLGIAVFAGGRR
jgi:Transglutaminase-like superfamily